MPVETTRQEEYLVAHPEYRHLAEDYHWSAPFGETTFNLPIFWLPVSECFPNAWNPNVEKARTFNGLVENVTEIGFAQNIQVIDFPRIEDEVIKTFEWFTPEWRAEKYKWVTDWKFMIIGGEHRVNAAVLKNMDYIPCVVMVQMDDVDYATFQTMRFNILAGETDPEKFVRMTERLLKTKKYSEPLLASMMGFVDKKAFDALFLQARQALPPDLRPKLDKAKKKIKSVAQLSTMLSKLLTEHGDDLTKRNFVMFALQGQAHLVVNMNKPLQCEIEWMIDHVRGLADGNISTLFAEIINNYRVESSD
jgi:hypothetical protein